MPILAVYSASSSGSSFQLPVGANEGSAQSHSTEREARQAKDAQLADAEEFVVADLLADVLDELADEVADRAREG